MAFKRVIYNKNDLREGDKVTVTWAGGNGPHVYTVGKDHFGWLRLHPGNHLLGVIGDPPLTKVLLHPRKEK